jgi:hypothetical protein
MTTVSTTASPTTTHQLPQLEGWISLFAAWWCFGFGTIISTLILRTLRDDGNAAIQLPTNMRDAIWLVLGLWATAYVAGTLIGMLHRWAIGQRGPMWSAVAGYLAGAGLYLVFLGSFPGINQGSVFDVVSALVSLDSLPAYYTFVILVLLVGPAIVAVAVYTGSLIAHEIRIDLTPPRLDPQAVVFAAVIPVALLAIIVAWLNLRDADAIDDIRRYAEVNTINLPPVLILHLDIVISPVANIILAAGAGILIGLRQSGKTPFDTAVSAGLGLAVHILAIFVLEAILGDYTFSSEVTEFEGQFSDNLGDLQAPDLVFFILLWLTVPLAGGTSAFAFHSLREPPPDADFMLAADEE